MARTIRTIKRDMLDDERAASLPDAEWRLWISCLLLADDFGNLRGEPRRIAAACFWAAANRREVEKLLANLETESFLQSYEVRGQRYYHIRNWAKHQRVDNPSRSDIPSFSEGETEPAANRGEPRRTGANRSLDPDPEGNISPPQASPAASFDFEAVYQAYPRKRGRTKGMQRCKLQIKTQAQYDALVIAVKKYANETRGREESYIKQFDTFMNCWEDYAETAQPSLLASTSPPSVPPPAKEWVHEPMFPDEYYEKIRQELQDEQAAAAKQDPK